MLSVSQCSIPILDINQFITQLLYITKHPPFQWHATITNLNENSHIFSETIPTCVQISWGTPIILQLIRLEAQKLKIKPQINEICKQTLPTVGQEMLYLLNNNANIHPASLSFFFPGPHSFPSFSYHRTMGALHLCSNNVLILPLSLPLCHLVIVSLTFLSTV